MIVTKTRKYVCNQNRNKKKRAEEPQNEKFKLGLKN